MDEEKDMLRTINELLYEAAKRRPDSPAVTHKEKTLTYREILLQACKVADALSELGVKKGDRVCFYLEKRLEKVVALFAVSLAGAVFVPVRWIARPGQAVHIIENSGAKVIITTPQKLALLTKWPAGLSGAIAVVRGGEKVPSMPAVRIRSWTEIIAGRDVDRAGADVIGNDLAAILYTSGSSGMPKGVVLSHGNILAGAYTVVQYLKIEQQDRLLSYLSFGFDYGLNQLMTTFLQNAHLILFDYLFPGDILRAVERYRITGLAAVSATWIQLLQIPWGDMCRSLRYVTNSGGTLPVRFVRELRGRIPQTEIFLMYGLTEAFRSTYLEPEMVDERPGSIGRAVPGEEIMVLDANNKPVKPGGTGELVHRGALVAQGYWREQEKSRRIFRPYPFQSEDVFKPEYVVYSGDYVRVDDGGYLYFEGRKDDMIKSAGNRISPTEVEEVLYNSGLVVDVVTFGIPHYTYGQTVCVVASIPGEDASAQEQLMSFCRSTLPPYMVPTHIEIHAELPRNANGKLDRAEVKRSFFSAGRWK